MTCMQCTTAAPARAVLKMTLPDPLNAQVTTRLEDVQQQLRKLVAAETLLVAHSGENDMAALKVGVWWESFVTI